MESERREPDSQLGGFGLHRGAKLLDRADIRQIVMRNRRYQRLRSGKPSGRNLCHARDRLLGHGSMGGMVHLPVNHRIGCLWPRCPFNVLTGKRFPAQPSGELVKVHTLSSR